MKSELERLLREALRSLVPAVLADAPDPAQVVVERARDPQHGDFACNIAMRLAKAARKNPRELAQAIVAALPANSLITRAEIAGAGFINFRLAKDAWFAELRSVAALGEAYGRSQVGSGRKVMIEFVSANPTGPMHVGHGRLAAYGATLGNLLEATGHDLYREYYINDAGRQIDILAVSVYLRYLELAGESVPFPSNGYKADYILPVAQALHAKRGDALEASGRGHPAWRAAGCAGRRQGQAHRRAHRKLAPRCWARRNSIPSCCSRATPCSRTSATTSTNSACTSTCGTRNASSTSAAPSIVRIEALRKSGHMYTKDGAEWFKSTDYGDDEDRVVIRANGEKTYFASDIAYHFDKRQRGHDLLIDVWGADHHGYVTRVRGALMALGAPGDCFEVTLMQLVSLYRGGEKLSMGKREGNFVTLRDLRNEVGNDACRFFYLMRSHDQALDFDLELAKSAQQREPGVLRAVRACARELGHEGAGRARFTSTTRPRVLPAWRCWSANTRQAVITALSKYPETIEQAALNRAPHALVHYLRDLANALHTYYNVKETKWIVEDASLRNARITLVLAVQQVIRNGLGILGVSAPESM